MAFAPVKTFRMEVTEASRCERVPAELPAALLTNLGPGVVFVRFGVGETEVWADMDLPILAYRPMLVTKGVGADTIAATTGRAGETATLFVTTGTGG